MADNRKPLKRICRWAKLVRDVVQTVDDVEAAIADGVLTEADGCAVLIALQTAETELLSAMPRKKGGRSDG